MQFVMQSEFVQVSIPYRCFSASQIDHLRAQTARVFERDKILTRDFVALQLGYTATS